MKGLAPLFLGIFGTFAFSWVGLTVIPNWQIGHLDPQSDEEGTDIYPMPQSGMVERGARVYAANGCIYCHSQQVRADYAAAATSSENGAIAAARRAITFSSILFFLGKCAWARTSRTWCTRATGRGKSRPRLAHAAPQASAASPAPSASAQGGQRRQQLLLLQQRPQRLQVLPHRTANQPRSGGSSLQICRSSSSCGEFKCSRITNPAAGPPWPEQTAGEPPMYSAAWHHVHLYSPRSINLDSNMPSYRFLYEKRRISDARSADALQLTGSDAPPEAGKLFRASTRNVWWLT